MRVTLKGQVTIPRRIREELGIQPHSEVDFVKVGKVVELRKAKAAPGAKSRGARLIERLRGRRTVHMSTDQILALTRAPRRR